MTTWKRRAIPIPTAGWCKTTAYGIPDRFALRGLPDTPELATARGLLRTTADAVGAAGLFSTTAPIRIPAVGAPSTSGQSTPTPCASSRAATAQLDLARCSTSSSAGRTERHAWRWRYRFRPRRSRTICSPSATGSMNDWPRARCGSCSPIPTPATISRSVSSTARRRPSSRISSPPIRTSRRSCTDCCPHPISVARTTCSTRADSAVRRRRPPALLDFYLTLPGVARPASRRHPAARLRRRQQLRLERRQRVGARGAGGYRDFGRVAWPARQFPRHPVVDTVCRCATSSGRPTPIRWRWCAAICAGIDIDADGRSEVDPDRARLSRRVAGRHHGRDVHRGRAIDAGGGAQRRRRAGGVSRRQPRHAADLLAVLRHAGRARHRQPRVRDVPPAHARARPAGDRSRPIRSISPAAGISSRFPASRRVAFDAGGHRRCAGLQRRAPKRWPPPADWCAESADVRRSDGVSGLWRFETGGHGIFAARGRAPAGDAFPRQGGTEISRHEARIQRAIHGGSNNGRLSRASLRLRR